MSDSEPGTPRATKRGRRWFLRTAFGLGLIGAVLAATRAAFRLWIYGTVEPDAPNIAVAMDDTLLNQLGITRATYDQAVARAGGRVVTFEPDGSLEGKALRERIRTMLAQGEIDGVLLSGGGDVDPELYAGDRDEAIMVNRARDDFEVALIAEAADQYLPILGICRGAQLLNVAFGGTLRSLRGQEELSKVHFSIHGHGVELLPHSKLAAISDSTELAEVYSFHGQAVDRPGEKVEIVGRSTDGLAEAIEIDAENKEAWIVGVQWHPEMVIFDKVQRRLFDEFVNQAGKARGRRVGDSIE